MTIPTQTELNLAMALLREQEAELARLKEQIVKIETGNARLIGRTEDLGMRIADLLTLMDCGLLECPICKRGYCSSCESQRKAVADAYDRCAANVCPLCKLTNEPSVSFNGMWFHYPESPQPTVCKASLYKQWRIEALESGERKRT